MPRNHVTSEYDALVIGAGIIGCSVAYELAKSGRRTLVVDAGATAGSGSTGASSAIIRFHYSVRESVAAAWESYAWWLRWGEYLGVTDPAGLAKFIRTGGLVLDTPDSDHSDVLRIFDEIGVPYERLTASEIRRRYPAIDPARYGPPAPVSDDAFWSDGDGELGGYLTPDAGYVDDPQLAAHNIMVAAERRGAQFAFRQRVTAVRRDSSQVRGVVLESGAEIHAPVVVNVGGPASSVINRLAGVTDDMRVHNRPLRTETHVVPAPPRFSVEDGGVFVTDPDLGSAFRPHAGNLVHVSSIEPECDPLEWIDDPERYNDRPTRETYDRQVYRVARRLPELGVPQAPLGLGALYDVTEDWTPIFDRSSLAGFYMACGTSGNSFKLAPIVGRFLLEIIEASEAGHDHDAEPVTVHCPATGLRINLGVFSRRRLVTEGHARNVLG